MGEWHVLFRGRRVNFGCSSQHASTHHGTQQGRQPPLPDKRQRLHWTIVLQVLDGIHSPREPLTAKATVFGILKELQLEFFRSNPQPIDRSGFSSDSV
ncbi:hypothetical protein TNCV_608551 [Trichonephila clavipes]|nr:hypothetical protein TNCV_608551 [Trichonephila clavipes]